MRDTRVLILDDEAEILENLERLLSEEGFLCRCLQSPTEFRVARRDFAPDVIVTDLKMPSVGGMTILTAARADDSAVPVIVITGHGTVSSAVEAMHEGAFDYLTKPFSADQFLLAVQRAARHRHLVRENRELAARVQGSQEEGEALIGINPGFRRVVDQAIRVADTDANVLVTGESGTGKELVARLIHRRSGRASGAFVPVDCAALPEGLLENELFGHEKGAYTGAVARKHGLLIEAGGGTLFLDEIGELSPPLQSKLLRTLEERQFRLLGGSHLTDIDVRIVAATNVDLDRAVQDGTFRRDLFYRLNVVHLALPPLRQRPEDIALLAGRFLETFANRARREIPRISPDAWAALEAYPWPGNVRELRNVMQRAVALDDDGLIAAGDLTAEVRSRASPVGNGPGTAEATWPLDYEGAREMARQSFLRGYVHRLLAAHDGNVSQAAKTAGVSRRTLHRWMAGLDQGPGESSDVQ